MNPENIDWSNVIMKPIRGHVEVFTIGGRFLFSEDNEEQALEEIGRCYIESLNNDRVA